MSQENVEVADSVRRLVAAFNERDWGAFSAELDPEVEYTPREEHAVYHGPEGFVEYVERWLEAWETFSGEAEKVEIAPAGDRAFIALRFRGNGKGSGVEIDDRSGTASCAAAGSIASASTRSARKPSKPPGCRSRAVTTRS